MILLVAPAGYGKTTLAAEWLAEEQAVWYRPTRASADPAAFALELAHATEPLVQHDCAPLLEHLRNVQDGTVEVNRLAELLEDHFAGVPDGAWLVIDEYEHVAEAVAVTSLVERVLAQAPFRVLVTSRIRPPWASARKVIYGEVAEVTREQLAMTPAEAVAVMRGDARSATALVRQAEGWPAVIGLAALASAASLPPADVSDALFRYFAQEVLLCETAEVREFMLRNAVPIEVDAELLSESAPDGLADVMTAHLVEKGLLERGAEGRLRFHPLLRDFLRTKLAKEQRALFFALCTEASAMARREQRWEEAYELALDAGDVDAIGSVVAAAAPALFEAGRLETLERWLEACNGARAEAGLKLARVEVALRRGRLQEAWTIADAVVAGLTQGDRHAWRAFHLHGSADERLSRYPEALASYLSAADAAETNEERVTTLFNAINVAAKLEDESLEMLVSELDAASEDDVGARLLLGPAKLYVGVRQRDLGGIVDNTDLVLSMPSDARTRTRLLHMGAYLSLSRGDYRRALRLIREAIDVVDRFGLGATMLAYRLARQANVEIGLRHLRAASRTLDRLTTLTDERILVAEHRNGRFRLLIALGEFRQVLADADATPRSDVPQSTLSEYAGLNALAAAALGAAERVETEAAIAREQAPVIEGHYYSRFADVILRLRNREAAVEDQIVALARESFAKGIHDAFVLAYRAYPPLLGIAAQEVSLRMELTRLTAAANDHRLARQAGLGDATAPKDAATALSPRELEVLDLMAQGFSNRKIGERLFISPSTAKVHVQHIFAKLNVRTRTEAVVAARGLAAS
jgi:LuxR family maltose regulon positive regulatory protein